MNHVISVESKTFLFVLNSRYNPFNSLKKYLSLSSKRWRYHDNITGLITDLLSLITV